MSAEPAESVNCAADDGMHSELLRLTVGAVAEPSPELARHLALCAACSADLAGAREAVDAVRAALAPAALPAAMAARVQRRIEEHLLEEHLRRRRVRRLTLRFGSLAAAAVLCAAVAGRYWFAASPLSTHPVLTAEDVSAVRQSYELLLWDAPVEQVRALQDTVAEAARAVDCGAAERLPWHADDNWDVPVRSRAESRAARPRLVRMNCPPVLDRSGPDVPAQRGVQS